MRHLHLLQGNFKHGGTVPGEGPATDPAAVVENIHADHLIEMIVLGEMNAVALMEGHEAEAGDVGCEEE